MAETNITTVSIPKPLAEKIRNRCRGTGFNSISSYVTYVLRQIISSDQMPQVNSGSNTANITALNPNLAGNKKEEGVKEAFTKKEEEEVKARLKSLGYL